MIKVLNIIFLFGLLSCSTISNREQSINFLYGCNLQKKLPFCTASNDRGRWDFVPPKEVIVLRSDGPLEVICQVDKSLVKQTIYVGKFWSSSSNLSVNGEFFNHQFINGKKVEFEYPNSISIADAECGNLEKKETINIFAKCKNRQIKTVCEATNDKGIWRFETPAKFQVNPSSVDLTITCRGGLLGDYVSKISAIDHYTENNNSNNKKPPSVSQNSQSRSNYPEYITLGIPLCNNL